MKGLSRRFAFTLAILALAGGSMGISASADDATIVAPTGSFGSVAAAARGEASLAWDGSRSADEYACTACFAALELQHYLRKCTGQETGFPVVGDGSLPPGGVILLGGPRDNAATARLLPTLSTDDLGPEGYAIVSASAEGRRVLVIAGGSRIGTLYGAYDYLHRLGCRWFAPGPLHEMVPRLEEVSLEGFDVRERPAFFLRGFHAVDNRGDEPFFLWMARNRLNLWCAEEDDHPLLRKLGMQLTWGGHNVGFQFLQPDAPYPYDYPPFKPKKRKSPLPPDPYPESPNYRGDANHDGQLSYVETHPEWYGMIDGKRSRRLGNGGVNYCTSNPYATAELVENAMRELAEGQARDADLVNCWTLDVGRWCECEACRALGSPTDRYLRFVHAFDQGIKEAQKEGRIRRPVRLLFLVYADVLAPPTRHLPEGFDYDTCIGAYFPIKRCYVHALDDPACPINAGFLSALRGWTTAPDRYYRGQLCIGEYYNVSRYRCLPICFMHGMAHDIPYYYREAGARAFHYMHVTIGPWGNKALTNYQMARQLWDVDADVPALWDDYFQQRYGPAAGDMRTFYASLEEMLGNCTVLTYNLRDRLNRGDRNLFPDRHLAYSAQTRAASGPALGPSLLEMLAAAGACWQALEQATSRPLPGTIKERIAEDRRGLEYGEKVLHLYEALARGQMAARRGDGTAAHTALADARRLAGKLKADKSSATLFRARETWDAYMASSLSPALKRLKILVEKER